MQIMFFIMAFKFLIIFHISTMSNIVVQKHLFDIWSYE